MGLTIETARQFVLHNPEAAYKGNVGHAKYLEAVQVIEKFKQDRAAELKNLPNVLDNPRYGRMQR